MDYKQRDRLRLAMDTLEAVIRRMTRARTAEAKKAAARQRQYARNRIEALAALFAMPK